MSYSPGPDRLTPAARRVLQAIHDLSERLGVPPTLREIAEATELRSISTVASHITTLHRLALVNAYPGMPRGTYITDQGRAELGEQATLQDVLRRLKGAESALDALSQEGRGPDDWVRVSLQSIIYELEESA